jgi:hypothetical protein
MANSMRILMGRSRVQTHGDRDREDPRAVTRLALAQHAVVAVRQLVALGVAERTASRRVAAGAARLRTVVGDHRAGSTLTRNELEEAFLLIARSAGRAPDAVNHWIPFPEGGGAEGDFVWLAERLVVEVDGRGVHTTRRAFEHDRRRDHRLALLGWRVVRLTRRQVNRQARYVTSKHAGLLDLTRDRRPS